MAAPTTSFLAGLAPASLAGDGAHYVRAARPAHFAAMEDAVVGENLPLVDALDPEDNGADGQPARGGPALRRESGHAIPSATQAHGTSRSVASDAAASAPHRAQPPLTVTRPDTPPRGRRRTRAALPAPGSAMETVAPTTAGDIITSLAPPVIQRAPLREEVRAARVAAEQPHAAPVVHVTIDRIDVRAPAATPAVPPQKARRAAAQSLSEYLRQGSSTGGSGTAK